MPTIALTENQKQTRRCERRSELLADGLEKFMRRNHISQRELAEELGLGRNTLRRIMDEDFDMKIPVETMWKMFDLAGVRMSRATQDDV